MYIEINAPGQRNNVVDDINDTGKSYLKTQMELLGKLESNEKSKNGMILSA